MSTTSATRLYGSSILAQLPSPSPQRLRSLLHRSAKVVQEKSKDRCVGSKHNRFTQSSPAFASNRHLWLSAGHCSKGHKGFHEDGERHFFHCPLHPNKICLWDASSTLRTPQTALHTHAGGVSTCVASSFQIAVHTPASGTFRLLMELIPGSNISV